MWVKYETRAGTFNEYDTVTSNPEKRQIRCGNSRCAKRWSYILSQIVQFAIEDRMPYCTGCDQQYGLPKDRKLWATLIKGTGYGIYGLVK